MLVRFPAGARTGHWDAIVMTEGSRHSDKGKQYTEMISGLMGERNETIGCQDVGFSAADG